MLPVPDLVLQIAVGDDDVRQVQATARSPRGLRLLEACAG